MGNLWPTDIKKGIETKSPVGILKEQASMLGELTDNVIKAEVRSSRDYNTANNILIFDFNIIAPALDNYRYRLFSVSYDIRHVYPVDINADEEVKNELWPDLKKYDFVSVTAKDENQFLSAIKDIFGTNATKNIIKSLLESSRSVEPIIE